jgi:hypothetical protein
MLPLLVLLAFLSSPLSLFLLFDTAAGIIICCHHLRRLVEFSSASVAGVVGSGNITN